MYRTKYLVLLIIIHSALLLPTSVGDNLHSPLSWSVPCAVSAEVNKDVRCVGETGLIVYADSSIASAVMIITCMHACIVLC